MSLCKRAERLASPDRSSQEGQRQGGMPTFPLPLLRPNSLDSYLRRGASRPSAAGHEFQASLAVPGPVTAKGGFCSARSGTRRRTRRGLRLSRFSSPCQQAPNCSAGLLC